MKVYYTPTLDTLLRKGEIKLVPYRIHEGWVPKPSQVYWSYKRNEHFEVQRVDPDGNMAVFWLRSLKSEVIRVDGGDMSLQLKEWEFDLNKIMYDRNGINIIMKGGPDQTSIKGAEIKALLCIHIIVIFDYGFADKYFGSSPQSKIGDHVFYYFHKTKYGMVLERDLDKSPRKILGNVGDGI